MPRVCEQLHSSLGSPDDVQSDPELTAFRLTGRLASLCDPSPVVTDDPHTQTHNCLAGESIASHAVGEQREKPHVRLDRVLPPNKLHN